MGRSNIERCIAGYILGISIFIILIPYGIFYLASSRYCILSTTIFFSKSIRIIISSILLINGIVFIIWSNIFLLRKGKGGPTDLFGIAISPQTKKLVVTGPYRFTRNPMVYGVFSTYFSIAVYFDSLSVIFILLIFFILFAIYLKLIEEKRLINDFGNEYIKYRGNTPMIIPFPWKRK